MTTPGGPRTPTRKAHLKLTRARRTGFYRGVGATTVQGSDPSLCPGPMLQDVSYVQISVVYIRNLMPNGMIIPSSASLVYRGGAMLAAFVESVTIKDTNLRR